MNVYTQAELQRLSYLHCTRLIQQQQQLLLLYIQRPVY